MAIAVITLFLIFLYTYKKKMHQFVISIKSSSSSIIYVLLMIINVRRPMIAMAKWHLLYEQMNNYEVADGPLSNHCDTIVLAESGPWSTHIMIWGRTTR